ncbi:hypothetical protein E3E12_08240 [Formicincola oecophyllae]|uniref:Uncharacterized protein n=1 Tax=Formicincola oecophyllae TaxID=2558361 RepID=A0A4Y6U9W1_9PROT|nr:hypothetical protein [Formicincola oecophyllae]QDH14182.1 hypothetical protein E3E12_08240 [Formicincola oecophyllae]
MPKISLNNMPETAPKAIKLKWTTTRDANDLPKEEKGIFVIESERNGVIFVGSGAIGERVLARLEEKPFEAYIKHGLRFAWAPFDEKGRSKAVVAWLQSRYNPRLNAKTNSASEEIPVNLPFPVAS